MSKREVPVERPLPTEIGKPEEQAGYTPPPNPVPPVKTDPAKPISVPKK